MDPLPIVIRAGEPRDIPALVAFQRAMALETEGKELPPAVLERGVRGVFEDPRRGRYRIAERGGEPIGALMLTSEWSDWRAADFWWIQSVFVLGTARGGGVFRALYDDVLREARAASGVCGLRLYVEHENAAAQAVYRRVGMAESHYRFFELFFA